MKKVNFFILLIILTIFFLGFLFYLGQKIQSEKNEFAKYEKVLSDKEAILVLDYGNQKQRWFKGEVTDDMTVFDALTTASLAGKFNFQANSHLTTLDNLTSNEKSKWTCYLNNKEITEPLNKITIKPKDKIICRYR